MTTVTLDDTPPDRDYDPAAGSSRANFRRLFPEFAAQPDVSVDFSLMAARMVHSVNSLATLYAAAHLLVQAADMTGEADGGDGVVTSEGLGGKSASYTPMLGKGKPRETFWATSAYGRMFLEIEARTPRLVVSAKVVG